jgi:hypothetical protein
MWHSISTNLIGSWVSGVRFKLFRAKGYKPEVLNYIYPGGIAQFCVVETLDGGMNCHSFHLVFVSKR